MSDKPSIDTVFCSAIEIEAPDERRVFVEQACGEDVDLKHQVERLLHAHFHGRSLLDAPFQPVATVDEPLRETAGTVIGQYKLLEQIGEGGFGIVFMAEQQEPIRRKVALKVLKPGMDTRQVIARFEAERQALALMDHVNIAKVLDAGQTNSSRPYFVMDLVKGVPITEFCDLGQLTPRERLELFVHVCQAVQHAHQKGIIHRDIKPSNVLVTLHDGTPLVKVIDFGIAKALGQQLTDKTLFTAFAQMIGTPLYMAPEQAALSNVDVDTRSDIYSLGVLLYELLTGTTPFDRERFKEAGYDEIRRIIREEEPPKPSTRISTLGQAATTLSTQRKSDPKRLSQLFRGELDWIVMKCLEKDRNRRYETANGLAMDIQHYLHDEPVQACPPSAWYRFRKFARRNKAALAIAGLLGVMLLVGMGGLAVSNVLISREKNQREAALATAKANQEAAEANLQLARKAVDELYTQLADEMQILPRMQPLQQKFLLRALDFYKEFARQNGSDPSTRFGIALAYIRVGGIRTALGQRPEGKEALGQGITLLEKLVHEFPDERQYRAELASAYNALGGALVETGQTQQGGNAFRQALGIMENLVAKSPGVPYDRLRLSNAFVSLGTLPGLEGREAEKVLRDAIRLSEKLVAEFADNPGYRHQLIRSHYTLGHVLVLFKRYEEAEQAYRKAIALYEVAPEPLDSLAKRRTLAEAWFGLGTVMAATNRNEEAESAYRQAVPVYERCVADFPDVPFYQVQLADSYFIQAALLWRDGKSKEAEEQWLKAVECFEKLSRQFPDEPAYPATQASVYYQLTINVYHHRPREAKEAWKKLVQLYETSAASILKDPSSGSVQADHYYAYARGLAAVNRPREAEKACIKAVELYEKLAAQSDSESLTSAIRWRLSILHHLLGRLFQAGARPHDAEKAYRKAIELHPERALYNNDLAWLLVTDPDPKIYAPAQAVAFAKKATELRPRESNVWNTLGVAYFRAGEHRNAIDALKKSEELGRGSAFGFNAFFSAMAHWQLNEPDAARKWYGQAVEWMDKNKPNDAELKRFRDEAAELLGVSKKKD